MGDPGPIWISLTPSIWALPLVVGFDLSCKEMFVRILCVNINICWRLRPTTAARQVR